jgi:hypothetical protein
MAQKLDIDCSSGQTRLVPLTPAEQADFDARNAAAPALEAARQTLVANYGTLQQRAQAALAKNATYLALPAPANVDVVAQVALLTKECTALIRLVLNALDSTAGT